MVGLRVFESNLRGDRIPARVQNDDVSVRENGSVFGAERDRRIRGLRDLRDAVEGELDGDAEGVGGGWVVEVEGLVQAYVFAALYVIISNGPKEFL